MTSACRESQTQLRFRVELILQQNIDVSFVNHDGIKLHRARTFNQNGWQRQFFAFD